VRRLHPAAGQAPNVDRDGLGALYGVDRPDGPGRPWLGLCMVASLDGSTSLAGRSGALGNDNDRAVLSALRRAADVILVGAGTVAVEGYRPPRKDGQRIAVVTSRLRLDLDSELFRSGAGLLVLPADGPETPPGIDAIRAGTGVVDLRAALVALAALIGGARFVQAEGGPQLNGALLEAGCVDEINLTIAPLLTGGPDGRIVAGASESARRFEPAHVLADDDGYLFTRWVRRR